MTAHIPECPPHATIADGAGVTVQAVRNWSSGQRQAPARVVLVLADIVGERDAVAIVRQWEERRLARAD